MACCQLDVSHSEEEISTLMTTACPGDGAVVVGWDAGGRGVLRDRQRAPALPCYIATKMYDKCKQQHFKAVTSFRLATLVRTLIHHVHIATTMSERRVFSLAVYVSPPYCTCALGWRHHHHSLGTPHPTPGAHVTSIYTSIIVLPARL